MFIMTAWYSAKKLTSKGGSAEQGTIFLFEPCRDMDASTNEAIAAMHTFKMGL